MCARSVVSVDRCCQVWPSGLITTLCVRAASGTVYLSVECAARLPAHLLLCSAAACATGELNLLDIAIGCMCRLYSLSLFNLDDLYLRWVHSECALPGELPEDKCICLLCKVDHQQSITQPHTTEIQTREASEETEARVDSVETTIQTDADVVTDEQKDLVEVTPEKMGKSEMGQGEATTDTETPMDLGKTKLTKHFELDSVC